MPPAKTGLARNVNLTLLVLYGLGVTIGAGIYVIIGAAAASAGYYTALAFLIASVIAGLSAFSFAELSTRYPVSAGEAAYIEAGLGWRGVSLLTGLAIALSGCISTATLLQGGTGYLKELLGLSGSETLMFLVLLLLVGGLVAWGISQSMIVAAVFTIAEIGGLLAIIFYAPNDPVTMTADLLGKAPTFDWQVLFGLSTAVMLAFFAFIGFEDMVNVVEEVRDPDRTMPLAIALTLLITTVLYIWIALIVTTAVSPEELGNSSAPLTLVLQRIAGGGEQVLGLVAIGAVVNGAIIQMVMISRVLYGLANLNHVPAFIAKVNPVTKTPLIATAIAAAAIVIIGLSLELTALATTTSSFTLAAFALVNFSLLRIKRRPDDCHNGFRVPLIVPILGFAASVGFLVFETGQRLRGFL